MSILSDHIPTVGAFGHNISLGRPKLTPKFLFRGKARLWGIDSLRFRQMISNQTGSLRVKFQVKHREMENVFLHNIGGSSNTDILKLKTSLDMSANAWPSANMQKVFLASFSRLAHMPTFLTRRLLINLLQKWGGAGLRKLTSDLQLFRNLHAPQRQVT